MGTVEFTLSTQDSSYRVQAVQRPNYCFKMWLNGKYLGTLYKVYNQTWEWLDGEESLKYGELLGNLIEEQEPSFFPQAAPVKISA